MVASLTEAQRNELSHRAKLGWGYGRAAKHVGCSKAAARRWMVRERRKHSVQPEPRTGRPVELGAALGDEALRLARTRRFAGAPGVAHELHRLGLTARVYSGPAVLKAIKAAAKRAGVPLYFWRGNVREALSEEHMGARLSCALKHRNTNFDRVVFSDRKKFWWHYPGDSVPHCCWLAKGETISARAQRGSRKGVNVYCALTRYGLTAMHVVSGTWRLKTQYKTQQGRAARGINKQEYKVVLTKTLLPGASKLMAPRWGKDWVFMQDGDKAHGDAAAAIAAFNSAKHQRVELLASWPARSCDLNPIEHVWAHVQRRLNARGCKTWAAFKRAVGQEMQGVPQTLINSLYDSMPRRMEAVIEAGGARTKY